MNDHELFGSIIQGIPFAMLTTESAKTGILRSRPMTVQQAEFDGSLWFFSGLDTEVVRDIEANHQVNLSFTDTKQGSFLSAYGRGEIVQDTSKSRELWSDALSAWFPEGLADPSLCLIKVDIAGADFWKSAQEESIRMFDSGKRATDKRLSLPTGTKQHFNLS